MNFTRVQKPCPRTEEFHHCRTSKVEYIGRVHLNLWHPLENHLTTKCNARIVARSRFQCIYSFLLDKKSAALHLKTLTISKKKNGRKTQY